MRKVWTFFYGSFMNPEVLAKADVRPTEAQMARLDGWDIRIAPRATLVPADAKTVFGVIARLSHPELEKLYTKDWFGFGRYLPEAVQVADSKGCIMPALTYISWEMETGTASPEYLQKLITVANQFEFPDWYVDHLKSFGAGSQLGR